MAKLTIKAHHAVTEKQLQKMEHYYLVYGWTAKGTVLVSTLDFIIFVFCKAGI